MYLLDDGRTIANVAGEHPAVVVAIFVAQINGIYTRFGSIIATIPIAWHEHDAGTAMACAGIYMFRYGCVVAGRPHKRGSVRVPCPVCKINEERVATMQSSPSSKRARARVIPVIMQSEHTSAHRARIHRASAHRARAYIDQ